MTCSATGLPPEPGAAITHLAILNGDGFYKRSWAEVRSYIDLLRDAAIRLREERDQLEKVNLALIAGDLSAANKVRAKLTAAMEENAKLKEIIDKKLAENPLYINIAVVEMVLKEDDESPISSLWYSIVAAARAAKEKIGSGT